MANFLLAIYIALIFIRPQEWWPPLLGYELVNLAAIGTILCAFPKIMNEFTMLARKVPEIKVAFALLVGVTLSWLFPTWLQGMLDSFQTFGKVVILFCLIILLGRDPKRLRVLRWTVFLCIAWMAIHGHLEIHSGGGFGGEQPIERRINPEGDTVPQIIAFGIFQDPNDLCLVFILGVPLLYAEYKSSRQAIWRVISLLLIPLYCYGAWLTNSRGGIVGIFGMISAYAVGRAKGFRRWVIAAFCIGLVTVAAPARFAKVGEVDFGRIDAWGDGINSFKHSPIFGVGYNNYASISGGSIAAHNSYVNALTELGLVGYVPFFLLLFLTIAHLRRAMALKQWIGTENYIELSGLFSALVGYLTAVYFLTRTYNLVLYILLAFAICQVQISCSTPELYEMVYGHLRNDLRRGVIWCLSSIPFIWITIRIANSVGGR